MGSKKRTPEHRAEMAARKAKREQRADRQTLRKINEIAMDELVKRMVHDAKMGEAGPVERFSLEAKGTVGKHASTVGTPNSEAMR